MEIETRQGTKTVRRNAVCKICKSAHSTIYLVHWKRETRWSLNGPKTTRTERSEGLDGELRFICCGKKWKYTDVKGTFVATVECNAKCTASKGHICECSCGGRNHGAGHA